VNESSCQRQLGLLNGGFGSDSHRMRVLGMRWWLAAAFALVAAASALAVTQVLSSRSEHAFKRYARDLAAGNAVSAAEVLKKSRTRAELRSETRAMSRERGLSLYVFDGRGRLISDRVSNGIPWAQVAHGRTALAAAVAGGRYVSGSSDGDHFAIGLRLRGGLGGELVSYSLRPELRTQLGIVRNEFTASVLWAVLIGAAIGLLIATLIARRLDRFAQAAQAIENGDFSQRVSSRFPDEVGSLGRSIEAMRIRLSSLVQTFEEERRHREGLLDRLHDGVLLVNSDLRTEYANNAAHRLLGGDAVAGAPLPEPWPELSLEEFTRGLFQSRTPAQQRFSPTADTTLALSGIPPRGDDTAILVVTDESARERTERAQREFATNAAHELRTPLAAIVTSVEMLQTGAKDVPADRDEFLGFIELQAHRLTRITQALLVLARAEAGQESPRTEPVVLLPLFEHVRLALMPRASVPIEIECSPALTVWGHADLLEQAVTSLTANALSHTTSGAVTLRACELDAARVEIRVEDTGSGISAAHRPHVFDRFYRATSDGVSGFGLGLAIARQVVSLMGGEIDLDSEPGVGTTVRIRLSTVLRERAA